MGLVKYCGEDTFGVGFSSRFVRCIFAKDMIGDRVTKSEKVLAKL